MIRFNNDPLLTLLLRQLLTSSNLTVGSSMTPYNVAGDPKCRVSIGWHGEY